MSFADDLKSGVNPYRERFHEVIKYLIGFSKNPVRAIRTLPEWDWATLLLFVSASAAITGTLNGIVSFNFTQVISGIFLFPITSTISAFIFSGLIYYTFLFVFHRELSLKTIFTITALSMLPSLLVSVLSGFLPPINLLGFLASALLLSVGLSEHSHIDRKKIFKFIGALYLVYVAFWIANAITSHSERKRYKYEAMPESLNLLREELKQ